MRRFRECSARARLVARMGAAALLIGCGEEPVRTADGASDSPPTVVVARSLTAVLESLPAVAAAPLTDEQRRGQALYSTLCWTCHGPYGHGDGPTARSFPNPLPDLGIVAAGSSAARMMARMRAMRMSLTADSAPAWHALPPDSLRLALAYLRTMRPTTTRGNPAAGRLLYATYCVQCHGVDGRGDGRLASGFRTRPANLRTLHLAGREGDVLAHIRQPGSHDHRAFMPDWGLVLADERLWDLVAYLAVYQAR